VAGRRERRDNWKQEMQMWTYRGSFFSTTTVKKWNRLPKQDQTLLCAGRLTTDLLRSFSI